MGSTRPHRAPGVMMCRRLLLLLLLFVSQPVWAAWVLIGDSSQGHKVYGDFETLRRTSGARKMWTMWNYASPMEFPDGLYLSSKILKEYDCNGRRTRTLLMVGYSALWGEGNVFGNTSFGEPRWEISVPESIGEGELNAVCRLRLK